MPPKGLGAVVVWAGPPPSLALTGAGLGPVDLQQEDDDGQQVGDVPQDAEDIHGATGPLALVGEGGPKTPRGALSSAERSLPSC